MRLAKGGFPSYRAIIGMSLCLGAHGVVGLGEGEIASWSRQFIDRVCGSEVVFFV